MRRREVLTNRPIEVRDALTVLETQPYPALDPTHRVRINRAVLQVVLVFKPTATLGYAQSETYSNFAVLMKHSYLDETKNENIFGRNVHVK